MRTLVYMVALGAPYRELAYMLVDTLRRAGQYQGDILVFTDDEMPGVRAKLARVNPKDYPGRHGNLYRWLLAPKIPADQYDQIMYFDVDILCRNPLAPLWCAKDCLRFATESNFISEWPTVNQILMSADEAEGKPVLNSGQFAVDGRHFQAFCRLVWSRIERALHANPAYKNDQSAFNAVIHSREVEKICPAKNWPAGSFNFSCGTKRFTDAILWHYNRRGDFMRQRYYDTGDTLPQHGEGMAFNAGVLRRPYGYLVADRVRIFNGRNDVILRRFDRTWNEIYRTAPNCLIGMQDVRLLDAGNRVLAYGTMAVDPGGTGKVCMATIRIEDTVECCDGPRVNIVPSFPCQPREKNWQLFKHEDAWLASYSLVPHIVVSLDVHKGTAKQRYISEASNWAWRWGEARGGTPWIQVGDVMVSAFHSLLRRPEAEADDPRRALNGGKCLHYYAGWLVAEAKPPFRLLAQSQRPIEVPLVRGDTSEHFVIFPMSLWQDGDELVLVYGENDLRTRIMRFAWKDVQASLVPLVTARSPLGEMRHG